jgi:hypothetical protein
MSAAVGAQSLAGPGSDGECTDSGSESCIFTAEKIVDMRRNEFGVREYRVRWEGYSAEDDTWEPSEKLLDPVLLETWESGRAPRDGRSSR